MDSIAPQKNVTGDDVDDDADDDDDADVADDGRDVLWCRWSVLLMTMLMLMMMMMLARMRMRTAGVCCGASVY